VPYGFCAFAIDKYSDEFTGVVVKREQTTAFPMLNSQALIAPF
jgi:hypothetical protein